MTYTVLIADDNKLWCRSLSACLDHHPSLHLLPPAHRGSDAIETIEVHRPDILIIDLVLPIYDGLYIINYIHREIRQYKPIIYVLSAIGTEKTNNIMRGLAVDYYSVKPIAESAVLDNLINLTIMRERDHFPSAEGEPATYEVDLDRLVDDFLYELGAPLYRISTQSLRLALRIALEDETILKSSMDLYYKVSLACTHTQSVHAIERNLRTTIKTIQDNGNACFHKCFPEQKRRMTNTEFLNKSVYILKLRIESFTRSVLVRTGPIK